LLTFLAKKIEFRRISRKNDKSRVGKTARRTQNQRATTKIIARDAEKQAKGTDSARRTQGKGAELLIFCGLVTSFERGTNLAI